MSALKSNEVMQLLLTFAFSYLVCFGLFLLFPGDRSTVHRALIDSVPIALGMTMGEAWRNRTQKKPEKPE